MSATDKTSEAQQTSRMASAVEASEANERLDQPKVGTALAKAPPPTSKVAKSGKPRIDCVDGCRFALVMPIVIAHFAR
eukprot:CAMPEP_0115257674 /NCGR_PEP_ID=MMETSP0270-20121206/46895_1 /TAXON_ID=71861 /ORGANISM="Scrippsiella trochoidea, Strain CCMP3099" /LENGTH=77 /DNA_ID=CAMNT_0002673389 /DNA_START=27 /DNA_END=257 /DNA_ORIENTATION=+